MSHPLIRRHFHSVAGLFTAKYLKLTKTGAQLADTTAAIEANLCPTERYAQQISSAMCTGALVGPNVILTAGHCVTSQADCNGVFVGFDYLMKGPSDSPRSLPAENVYRCRRILARDGTNLDYAFLELDRPVANRPYFQFDLTDQIDFGDRVFVIGHPIGIPLKIGDGMVRAADDDFVETDLDTFEGNSGSPVFSFKNGLIVGILVNGEEDFVKHGSCRISKKCGPKECKGEQVVRITSILASYYNKKP